MDKNEFSMKMDRLKQMVAEKDYATALKIVDGIEWERVKSPNLLALASSVYEENDLLEDAKDKLVLALERSSGGKRILYKLTELAVRSGNVDEAMDYYEEYKQVAGNDPACLLLQYMILKVRHAPYAQLVQCLELYNEYEPDEKWMYELATTYESAGRVQDAVALCDRIALMFGSSVYGVKALKLKQRYTKLTEEQRAALYPSSAAGNGIQYVKEAPAYEVKTAERAPEAAEERLGDRLAADRRAGEDEEFEAYMRAHDPFAGQNVPEEPAYVPEEELAAAAGPVPVERVPEPELPAEPEVKPAAEPERRPVPFENYTEAKPEEAPINEGFLTEDGEEAEAEEQAAPAEPEVTDEPEPEIPVAEKIPAAAHISAAAASAALAAAEKTAAPEAEIPGRAAGIHPAGAPRPQARTSFTVSRPAEEEPEIPAAAPAKPEIPGIRLIIEALKPEEGVAIAKKELSLLYHERGSQRNVARAGAEKLNSLGGMNAVTEKIGDRDLVIVQAGGLSEDSAVQLYELMKDRKALRSIVLVDTPEGLDALEDMVPGLFDICDILTDEDAREKDYSLNAKEPEAKREAPRREEPEDGEYEEEPVRESGKRSGQEKTRKKDLLGRTGNIPFRMPKTDDEVMEFDDFAQYCVHYANEKGCAISGKTLLALYEKIEIMEEDGIALNAIAAEDCVEEAAEHAEHPGLKGLFRKKYDKDDMLILREEDFIN